MNNKHWKKNSSVNMYTWYSIQKMWALQQNIDKSKTIQWLEKAIKMFHTYSYMVWKSRNNIHHQHKTKSQTVWKKIHLQERIATLYKRKNISSYQWNKGKKKGTESMVLWIKLVEAIFGRKEQVRQETIDIWMTGSIPSMGWKTKQWVRTKLHIL